MTTKIQSDEFVNWQTLRSVYALPCSWIEALGDPDVIEPHPYDPQRYKVRYCRKRVEAFIDSRKQAYLRMLLERAKTTGKNRQASELEQQIAWAKTVKINIEPLPALAQLRREAKASFQAGQNGNGKNFWMSDKALMAHIRHNKTNYHQLLAHLQKNVPGATVAYLIIRRRVNQKIRVLLKEAGDA
jgi:hypothetical protein